MIKTKWIDFEIWNLSSLSQDKVLNCVAPLVIYSSAFPLMILKSGAAIWSVLARKVDPGVLESWRVGERIGPRAAYLFTMLGMKALAPAEQ